MKDSTSNLSSNGLTIEELVKQVKITTKLSNEQLEAARIAGYTEAELEFAKDNSQCPTTISIPISFK
ncbi:MAG: hypothetical protein FWF65_05940 [Bacteroidetes bacterium]|nr:hypothetical protein [Bacteroidota bacterium]